MKNRLIFSVLTFTLIPCMGNSASQTTLLMHLKKVDVDIKDNLNTISNEYLKAKQDNKESEKLFIFFEKIFHEFYNSKNQIVSISKTCDIVLDLIHNNLKTFEEAMRSINEQKINQEIKNDEDNAAMANELKCIFEKHYTEHYKKNTDKNDPIKNINFNILMNSITMFCMDTFCEECYVTNLIISHQITAKILLEKIDTKIKKLQNY